MPNPNYTHIVFVLDRSGSMEGVRSATIESYNSFLNKQKGVAGKATISLYQFDDRLEKIYQYRDIQNAPFLNHETFQPRGSTALLGAMGTAIDETGDYLASLPEYERPGKVIMVILTDGHENFSHNCEWSRRYTNQIVFQKVTHQHDKYDWEFVYLGANQDAIASAQSFGISGGSAANYAATDAGMKGVVDSLSAGTVLYRSRSLEQTKCMKGKFFDPNISQTEEKDWDKVKAEEFVASHTVNK